MINEVWGIDNVPINEGDTLSIMIKNATNIPVNIYKVGVCSMYFSQNFIKAVVCNMNVFSWYFFICVRKYIL